MLGVGRRAAVAEQEKPAARPQALMDHVHRLGEGVFQLDLALADNRERFLKSLAYLLFHVIHGLAGGYHTHREAELE